jgi:Tn3 transposase DDE domain
MCQSSAGMTARSSPAPRRVAPGPGDQHRRSGAVLPANDKIYYGREGVLTGADREHAEVSMLALHLLQSSLVFINTQLLQAVLRDPGWAAKLTEEDRRGLPRCSGRTSTPTGGSASTWTPASTSPPPDGACPVTADRGRPQDQHLLCGSP